MSIHYILSLLYPVRVIDVCKTHPLVCGLKVVSVHYASNEIAWGRPHLLTAVMREGWCLPVPSWGCCLSLMRFRDETALASAGWLSGFLLCPCPSPSFSVTRHGSLPPQPNEPWDDQWGVNMYRPQLYYQPEIQNISQPVRPLLFLYLRFCDSW